MSRASSLSPSSSGDEEEEDEGVDGYRKGGYHAVRPGDQFAAGRYVAQRKLGWGNFSTVWLAFDIQSQKFVALKIQKSAPEFAQAALHEIDFLSEITRKDPSNCKCIIQLIEHFRHAGPNGQHICLVFEFLGDSLLKLVQYNRYRGIGLGRVREICRSILIGLDYLHRELGIIHSDLKLENILLLSTIDPAKDPIRSGLKPNLERPDGNPNGESVLNPIEKKLKMRARRVLAKLAEKRKTAAEYARAERSLDGIDMTCKIVDFGNACWADRQFTDFIQTRQYRAPEVILGAGYSFPVDMWSFACIAFELATGEMLFTPKEGQGYSEDEDHLAMMMELLGKMPKKIATMGTKSKEYFDRHGDLKRIRRLKFASVERVLVEKYKIKESDAREFAEFLCPLLDFAPEKRPTAAQCLQHRWLQCNDGKTCGALNIGDAKIVGVACSTGTVASSDPKSITHSIGSMPDNASSNVKNADVQPNTGSTANRNARSTDVNPTTGGIMNRDSKNSVTKPNIGSITSRDDKNSGTKSNIGSVSNRDAKTVDVKPNTGSITNRDNQGNDANSNIGSAANSDAKNTDVKRNIRSVVNSYMKNFDIKARNAGSIADGDVKNLDVKSNTGNFASADAKSPGVKPNTRSDVKNLDVKSNTGNFATADAKSPGVKPNTRSDVKNLDVKSNTGNFASADAKSPGVKPNTRGDVKNLDVKSNTGNFASADAKSPGVKPNTGSVENNDAEDNRVLQTNTDDSSTDDNSTDAKPNIGRVAASIQRLESSLSNVQIGRYR